MQRGDVLRIVPIQISLAIQLPQPIDSLNQQTALIGEQLLQLDLGPQDLLVQKLQRGCIAADVQLVNRAVGPAVPLRRVAIFGAERDFEPFSFSDGQREQRQFAGLFKLRLATRRPRSNALPLGSLQFVGGHRQAAHEQADIGQSPVVGGRGAVRQHGIDRRVRLAVEACQLQFWFEVGQDANGIGAADERRKPLLPRLDAVGNLIGKREAAGELCRSDGTQFDAFDGRGLLFCIRRLSLDQQGRLGTGPVKREGQFNAGSAQAFEVARGAFDPLVGQSDVGRKAIDGREQA